MAEEVSQETYRLICDRNMGIEGLLFEEVVVEDVNETRKAKRVWATQPYVELLERNVSTPSFDLLEEHDNILPIFSILKQCAQL